MPGGRITLTITADTIHDHATSAPRPPARAVGPGPPAGAADPGPPAQAARPGAPSGIARSGPLTQIAAAALRAAARALDTAHARARADTAAGGCAHHAQSPAYQPPPRLREHVIARDVTCRHPARRQPAWRADLDHTLAYEDHGRTCSCNLGGACRRDHQLKQHPRWKLEQTQPGHFTWTTPAGRTYTVSPDTHPL